VSFTKGIPLEEPSWHLLNIAILKGKYMQSGVVKMWDSGKGFGFVTTEDDEDLFVHSSDLHISVKGKRLFEGQKVKFDVRSDMKGEKAINVRVV